MKKKISFLLPLVMLLASCNGQNYAGTYSFKLGKDKSTHIGIYMNLTQEAQPDKEGCKKFTLRFDVTGSGTSGDSQLDSVSSLFNNMNDITGYYQILEQKENENSQRVLLGTNYLSELLDIKDLEIPAEVLENFLYANISGNTLTVNFPVSLLDLQYQLYWYGYRFDG